MMSKKNQKKISRNIIIFLLLACAFILIIGSISWLLMDKYKNREQVINREAMMRVDADESQRQFRVNDQASKDEAEEALRVAEGPDEQASAYRTLSSAYSASGDYQKSLEYAQKAVEADNGVDSYKYLINAADLAGRQDVAEEARQRVTDMGGWPDEVE